MHQCEKGQAELCGCAPCFMAGTHYNSLTCIDVYEHVEERLEEIRLLRAAVTKNTQVNAYNPEDT